MKFYIITREENQYDQYGQYFVAVFTTRPTVNQLMPTFNLQDAEHIVAGGGRRDLEETWYFLHEIEEGHILKPY